MTGFLQRQQCGYSWRNFGSSARSAPAAFRSSTISRVRVEHLLPPVLRDRGVPPALVHRREDGQALALAGLEVVFAVTGRGVYEAGAGVHRDVVAGHDPERPGRLLGRQLAARLGGKGMAVADAGEIRPAQTVDDLPVRPSGVPRDGLGALLGHDVGAVTGLDDRVGLVGVDGDREVRGDGPGRRRPDDRREPLRAHGVFAKDGVAGPGAFDRKCNGDRRVLALLVLELRLGQSRAVREAPPHRLQVAEEEVLRVEPPEGARDVRLVGVGHRGVRPLPVAADAEPPEFLALDVDEALRVLPARPPDRDGVHLAHLGSELLVDLLLDRQAVAVPARHVGRVEAEHRAAPDHAVLQDLVHRRAEMDVAVGVRRAVVEDELGAPRARGADLRLQVHRVPGGETLGLPAREIRLHGEVRAGEVERALVVGAVGHDRTKSSRERRG